ncbi:transposase [Azospirillum thiophilum]|uniref:Transposase n=1 Tax=Azospirillum thiophilum TaxID=528244 RepID=A0AAC9EYR2_9PROT|nr:IS200/IS605 family transposase [Azospirillum thiophilum]ALG75566.1 transposase [Azospirillum thiophilum]KJR62087.1 transposase [Azospirillum thiophilum]
MNTEYRRGRSVVCALHVHLVFVTKYRRDVFTDRAHLALRDTFLGVCAEFGVTLKEVNGEDDHVHLLIEYPPTVQLSRLVNSLKGVSSRRLRQQNFPEVKRRLWGDHLWSPSYFAASCGGAPLEIVKQYIEKQREEPNGSGKREKMRLSRP